ncbi:MAG: patatin-like phospholipase family protein [Myxococcota bacterium]
MTLSSTHSGWTALALAGGGSFGAYEVGVLRYLREHLPPRVSKRIHFDIVCGASSGAINCCHVAAYNHTPQVQGHMLAQSWQELSIEDVYQARFSDLLRWRRFFFGYAAKKGDNDPSKPARLGGLFNTAPLEQQLRKNMPWKQITTNIVQGRLQAVAVNALNLNSGKAHVFVQRAGGGVPAWSTDPRVHARPVILGAEHILASTAVPWIFPAVRLDGELYCDGSLKINTPISPAIRLGADRLVIIALDSHDNDSTRPLPDKQSGYPSALFLLNRILAALMDDQADYNLKRLHRFNALAQAAHPPIQGGQPALRHMMTAMRGASYRKIDTLVFRPSKRLGHVAIEYLKQGTLLQRAGGVVGTILRHLAKADGQHDGHILRFFLFDGEFACELMRLGMQDAHDQRQEIIDFFSG